MFIIDPFLNRRVTSISGSYSNITLKCIAIEGKLLAFSLLTHFFPFPSFPLAFGPFASFTYSHNKWGPNLPWNLCVLCMYWLMSWLTHFTLSFLHFLLLIWVVIFFSFSSLLDFLSPSFSCGCVSTQLLFHPSPGEITNWNTNTNNADYCCNNNNNNNNNTKTTSAGTLFRCRNCNLLFS